MPRFSANLGFLWNELPLLERIERAAAAGFNAIELHWPHDTPASAVRDACARHDLTLLSINSEPGDTSRGEFGLATLPGREADFRATVERSIEWASESGATMIHVLAGPAPRDGLSHARAALLANLAWAAETAGAHDLTLMLEPMNRDDRPGYFYHRATEAAEIITELDRSGVRMMYDAYHVGVEGDDTIAAFTRFKPLIAHIQIAAVPTRTEPDSGEVDFAAFFSAVDLSGYEGWIGCEYRPRTTVEEGLGWMRPLKTGI